MDLIHILQQQFPMGVKAAEKLLAATDGSVEKAAELYCKSMEELFISKTGAILEKARQFLPLYGYHMGKAIEAYEQEKYTYIGWLIRRAKSKYDALSDIVVYMYEARKNNTLPEDPESCTVCNIFYKIMEWRYEYAWEFSVPLDKEVANLLKDVLQMTELSDILKNTYDKMTLLRTEDPEVKLWENPEFKEMDEQLEKLLEEQEELLISRLYDYVVENINHFPSYSSLEASSSK